VSINNRWFQLVASLIAMVMIANLQYAWTLFVDPMQKQTGWALSEIQAAFALFILFQTWVQPLDGWLVDRLGPRWFITAAGVLCGLGWAGMGYATSLPMLYTAYCAAGMGAAFVYSCSIGSALKWFKDRRGLAAGIMAAGFGGGTALFIPVIQSLIASRGYQATFVATGYSRDSSSSSSLSSCGILPPRRLRRRPRRPERKLASDNSRRPRCCAHRSST